MKQYLARVIENRLLWGDTQLISLDIPELARLMRPGQFALARDPKTFDPYLRRTLWLYEIRADCIAFALKASDPLAIQVRVGDMLDLLAPLGRAIEFDVNSRHILLIGEGARIVPLVAIAHDGIKRGCEVVLASHSVADSAEKAIFPTHLLSPEIEYRTDDAMNPELFAWADALVVGGSNAWLVMVADVLRATRYHVEPGFARAILEMPMPCGIGVCYACAVETSRGVRLICVDGPAIDLIELERGRI